MKKKWGGLFKNQKKERRLFDKKLILPNNPTKTYSHVRGRCSCEKSIAKD